MDIITNICYWIGLGFVFLHILCDIIFIFVMFVYTYNSITEYLNNNDYKKYQKIFNLQTIDNYLIKKKIKKELSSFFKNKKLKFTPKSNTKRFRRKSI